MTEIERKAKVFDYCLESFGDTLDRFVFEGEELNEDLKAGERGYGLTMKCRENATKKKLMREVICFMNTTLEELSEDDDELNFIQPKEKACKKYGIVNNGTLNLTL